MPACSSAKFKFAHLVRRPEEVAAERHHPTLVGFLQQLGRVLGRLRRQSVVVGGVEALAREQRPRHRHQRSHLRLAVGKLVFIQDERLPLVTGGTGRRLVEGDVFFFFSSFFRHALLLVSLLIDRFQLVL